MTAPLRAGLVINGLKGCRSLHGARGRMIIMDIVSVIGPSVCRYNLSSMPIAPSRNRRPRAPDRPWSRRVSRIPRETRRLTAGRIPHRRYHVFPRENWLPLTPGGLATMTRNHSATSMYLTLVSRHHESVVGGTDRLRTRLPQSHSAPTNRCTSR